MSKRIAVFPGSFDPLTIGHESIVLRSLSLFDEIIVAVGINSSKTTLFPIEKRKQWIEETFKAHAKVKVATYTGLTIDFCKTVGAGFILRGLRTSADFEFERAIAQMNKAMAPEIETVFIPSLPELTAINSTIVRDIVKNGGNAMAFVPKAVTF